SRTAVVELIAATTTKTGLTVRCELDENTHAKGVKVSDAEMAALNIIGDAFHSDRNYSIAPRSCPISI
ncbi:MAG: ISAzo13-like element transposase-related protein, partial [Methylocella sp.]